MKVQKEQLAYLFKNGQTNTKLVSKLTGVPLRTVQRDFKKLNEGQLLKRKEGSGRPRLLKSADKQRLIQIVRRDDMQSSGDIQIKMVAKGSPNVSSRTIRRYLNRSGYSKKSPKRKPMLSARHKENRMKWCLEHLKTRWYRWVFSDESKFQLFSHKNKRWSKEIPRICTPKFGKSLMVWGAISSKGKSKLIFTKGSVDSKIYQGILQEATPSIRELHPKDFMFQQDGATCHTSKSTMDYLSSLNWKVSPWPANSPDLNPIENIWGIMKRDVEKRRPKNLDDLQAAIQDVWDNFPLSQVKSLCASMENRITSCIARKGDVIKY